ncbi:MAG: hypothetical protein ACK5R7_10190, partial [Armatimonadota bacterium]
GWHGLPAGAHLMPVVNYTTVNGRILHEDRNGVKTLFMPDTLGNVIETRNMDTGAPPPTSSPRRRRQSRRR